MLCVAHQFVEVNLGRGDERAHAAPPFHYGFSFQRGESVPRGHQAYIMDSG
jgi:hypothetical protein